MSKAQRLLVTLCSAAFSYAILCPLPAQAQNKVIVNNPDDREDSIPTNWWTYTHQTPTDISNTISTLNARAIDIFVEQFSPSYLFTVTYVKNAGPYYKGWWYYYGLDATTLANNLNANNARLISLKAYDIGGGQIRFAVVMISNTGKDNKGWWWYYGISASQIAGFLTTNNARLVQIHSYVTGAQTVYAVVMISNTGDDARTWWWYTDMTSAQITSLASSNNARVTDLDYIPADGNYNAIMVSCTGGCPAWWTYYGQTGSQLLALAAANGARVIDNNSYPGCGDVCFSFVLIDDSLPPLDGTNPIGSRVGQLLRAGGVTGVQGLYLKPVGGAVLANLEDSFVYEPASSIKVLAHLYSMTQVQNGLATLSTAVTHYTNGPSSCPSPATPSGTETLSTAMQEMMWHSDNARTREITDFFGDPSINSFGLSIGMPNSRINHIIGCGGPIPDQLTLDDANALYEGVANGSRLTSTNRDTFYSLMAGKAQFLVQGYDWTHLWDTDFPNIIAQSAPGATVAQRQSYQNQMNLAYKAGSYVLCDGTCTNVAEYLSITGLAEIPFCSGASTTLKDYVFGIYLHGAIDSSWFSGKNTVADANFNSAKAETLREQIVTGLASCGLASVSMTIATGNNQSVTVHTAFAPLAVTIKDANNNPVPNAVVTFTAPASGASGTFAAPCSGNTCNVTANSSGVATAPTFTANGSAGPYSVTASFNAASMPFSLTNTLPSPPTVVSVTPVNGSGLSQTFNATYSDSAGVGDLNALYLIFNSSLSAAHACAILYVPASNGLYLYNDAGSGFAPGVVNPGTAGTVSNTQCMIGNAGATTTSGLNLTLPVAVTFTASFGGVKNIYAIAGNNEGAYGTTWQNMGTWTPAASQAPSRVSFTPINGSASTQTFNVTFSEANGVSDLSAIYIVFNPSLSTAHGCLALYLPYSNSMYLYNDSGSAFVAGTISPGTAGTLSNTQCTIGNAGAATVSGVQLTLPVAITFTASFSGVKNVYAFAFNFENQYSSITPAGTWTTSASQAPTVVSVSPINGNGSPTTFSATYAEANGVSDLNAMYLLFNSTLSAANGCLAVYVPYSNSMYLYNDAGSTFVAGSITPGTPGTLSNSQCTIGNAGATTIAGTNLTLPVAVTFAAGFTGVKNVYGFASNFEGGSSGWQTVGTWGPH